MFQQYVQSTDYTVLNLVNDLYRFQHSGSVNIFDMVEALFSLVCTNSIFQGRCFIISSREKL